MSFLDQFSPTDMFQVKLMGKQCTAFSGKSPKRVSLEELTHLRAFGYFRGLKIVGFEMTAKVRTHLDEGEPFSVACENEP